MRYTDFLKPAEGFQYSINLQYDLGSNNKIRGYIPTLSTLKILNSYLKKVYYGNGESSTVLIGPYGKGKSHLMLILLTLLEQREENLEAIKDLISNIERVDNETAQLCRLIIEEKIKMMPIIINGSHMNLQQSFLIALNDALKKNEITDIRPKTYFESVLEIIQIWKDNYKDTISVLKNELIKQDIKLEDLEFRLKNFDKDAFEAFKKAYLVISSGIEYNPMINSDVAKLFDETNFLLCEKYGYKGMFIVFDEFSKFMEASVTSNTSKDLKILQDFAELSSRSSSKQQLNFVCITHKTINEYISKLPKEVINSWRAIEGRFQEHYLTSSSKQNFELITNAINKDRNKIREFIEPMYNDYFNKIERAINIFEGIYSENEYKEVIGIDCFPLNPVSVYCLPKISEKVAQNERTLFTFLCKDENKTLANFISKNQGELQLVNLDTIYDYFEDLFKKEVFNDLVHETWIKADAALRKCNNKREEELIKALAIINIISEFERLSPTKETLIAALNYGEDEISQIISSLKDKNLIYVKKSNEHINFIPVSETNVKAKIITIKNTRIKNINIARELESLYSLGYVLPKRYNDDYKMVRFFKNIYITLEQLKAFEDVQSLTEFYEADGVIANLIYFTDEEKIESINILAKYENERVLLRIPDKPFEKEESIKELLAIRFLKDDKTFLDEEPLANQLVEIYEDDLIEDIKDYLETYFTIENKKCSFYKNGEKIKIKRKAELNKIVSEICLKKYGNTPVINNELINKNNITTVISKARGKIVDFLLENYNNDSVEPLTGYGPEVTIYRATIKKFGLNESKHSSDTKLSNVLNIIRRFIQESEVNKRCFKELYEILIGENIGLRKGVIPIYLAFIMREFKDEVIIYFGVRGSKEINLTYDTLNNINNNPSDYFIKLEKGTLEKEKFLSSLISLFKKHINGKEMLKSRYTAIVKGMQFYIQSLSQFARTHKYDVNGSEVDDSIIRLRIELLKYDINSREFLLNKLLKITNTSNYLDCINKIIEIKEYLDGVVNTLKLSLIQKTKSIVNPEYQGKLTQNLKLWYEQLSESQKIQIFSLTTNRFIEFVKQLDNHDEIYVINKVANIVTGLSIEDWQDDTINQYVNELTSMIQSVEGYDSKKSLEVEKYRVEINENGEAIEKTFNIEEVSEIAFTLLNEIEELIEEYGESVEENEKRSILMMLLKKYM